MFASSLRCLRPTGTVAKLLLDFRPQAHRRSNCFRMKKPAPRQMLLLNLSCPNGEWTNRPNRYPKRTFTCIAREAFMQFSIPIGIPTAMFPTSLCFLIHTGNMSAQGLSEEVSVLGSVGCEHS